MADFMPGAGENSPPSIANTVVLSLIEDYNAGRLPPEAMARMEQLRDEFYADVRNRGTELVEGTKADFSSFGKDLIAKLQELEATGGKLETRITDEYVDTDALAYVVQAADVVVEKVTVPVIDAAEDIVRGVIDFVDDLAQVRFANDPDGLYADLRQDYYTESREAVEHLDVEMDRTRGELENTRDALGQLRDALDSHNEEQGPTRIHTKTSIDPGLSEDIEAETGQVTG
jgi:hypothetical protein